MSKDKCFHFIEAAWNMLNNCNLNNNQEVLNTLCQLYTRFFPDQKLYIAEKLGKRLSYLTGSGRELYLKPLEIPLPENYRLFIESNCELSPKEKEGLELLFSTALGIRPAYPERGVNTID